MALGRTEHVVKRWRPWPWWRGAGKASIRVHQSRMETAEGGRGRHCFSDIRSALVAHAGVRACTVWWSYRLRPDHVRAATTPAATGDGHRNQPRPTASVRDQDHHWWRSRALASKSEPAPESRQADPSAARTQFRRLLAAPSISN